MMKPAVLLALAMLLPGAAGAQTPQPGPVWPKLSAAQQGEVMKFGDDFKTFIGRAVSEMTFVREATALVEANGFKRWPSAPAKADVRPGSRWYAVNRDRTIVAFVVGSEPVSSGTSIVNTHNDSVRLELKPKPFRDSFTSPCSTPPHTAD